MSLISRNTFNQLLGLSFGGKRDTYAVFGYNKKPTTEQFRLRYEHEGIASRIVDAFPNAIWANPPKIGLADSELRTSWDALAYKSKLYNALSRADKLVGIEPYSVLLLGFDDSSDLSTPVDANKVTDLLYVQPYGASRAQIKKWDEDTKSRHFGLPLLYEINPGQENNNSVTSAAASILNAANISANLPNRKKLKIHWTRILHIAENCLEDNIFGIPRLQIVNNYLDDLLKVVGGTSETYWITSNRGLQVDVDKEMELNEDDAAALEAELDEYIHNLRRVIRTRGVKIDNLGSNTPNPRDTFAMILSVISGTTGIPRRILVGSEIGQLASTQDRANWAERISERRQLFCEPVIVAPLIQRFASYGLLPDVPNDKDLINWPSAFLMNPLESAQTNAQRARSLINTAKALTVREDLLTVDEARAIIELT